MAIAIARNAADLIKASVELGGSKAEADRIEKEIESGGPEAAALDRGRAHLRNVLRAGGTRWPLSDKRLTDGLDAEPAAAAALARLGVKPRSLYISAIRLLDKYQPHCFGA